ncbi:MAG TPA: hypothetical protein DEF82_07635 [Crocinitomicaceae bacterium]|nr:hypothetical protein [Flavobacteriales bacterium]HBW86595.1 hypothetical protein [Crocinitomicaceae bacterium]
MKLLFTIISFICLNYIHGQYSFSVKTLNEIDMETKETISSIEVNQLFNFSLKDGFMIHNLVDEEGNIEDSQFYKIIKKEEKNNIIFLSCESGVSGNVYRYFISEHEDNGTQLFQYLEENTIYQMEGKSSRCKTFKQ